MKYLPLEFAPVPVAEYLVNDFIEAADLQLVVGAGHWLWANMGARAGLSYDGTIRQWTTTSAVSTSANTQPYRNLDSMPVVLRPSRPEVDSTIWDATATIQYHALEILVEATNLDVVVDIYRITFDAARNGLPAESLGTPLTTLNLDCPTGAREIVRAYVMPELDITSSGIPEAYQFRITAAISGAASGELFTVQITEVNYINQSSYLAELVTYGAPWLGLFVTGSAMVRWDTDDAQFFFAAGGAAPVADVDFFDMRFSAFEFNGAEWCQTGNIDLTGETTWLVAVTYAADSPTSASTEHLVSKGPTPSLEIFFTGGQMTLRWNSSAGLQTLTRSRPADSNDHDIVGAYDGTYMWFYVDGEYSITAAIPGLTWADASGPFFGGSVDGATNFYSGRLGRMLVTTAAVDVGRFVQHRKSVVNVSTYAIKITEEN